LEVFGEEPAVLGASELGGEFFEAGSGIKFAALGRGGWGWTAGGLAGCGDGFIGHWDLL